MTDCTAAVPYSQTVLQTLADVEIPAAGIPAVENPTVVVDSLILDSQAEVDKQQVDMQVEHSRLAVLLQNQVVAVRHNWVELDMTQLEVQVHMGEGPSHQDTRDTWKHISSTVLNEQLSTNAKRATRSVSY